MIGEKVEKLLCPKDKESDLWCVLMTDSYAYNLRLGGFERISKASIEAEQYLDLKEVGYSGVITDVLTDEEDVYIIIDDGHVIESGWMDISLNGDLYLGVKGKSYREYEENFFSSSDLYRLRIGEDNFSYIIR